MSGGLKIPSGSSTRTPGTPAENRSPEPCWKPNSASAGSLKATAESSWHASSLHLPSTGQGRSLDTRFFQLTGTHLVRGQTEQTLQELPDPAPSFVTSGGEVEIYGSAPYFIRYANWNEFEHGGTFQILPLTLKFPSGVPIQGVYTHPWDLRKFRISGSCREIIVGGAMSPSFFRTPSGNYEMLFHGVSKNILPDNDYTRWPKKYELWQFFRSLFKANLEVHLNSDGSPSITPVLH